MKSLSPACRPISTKARPRSRGAGGSPAADGVTFGFTDHDRTLSFDGHRLRTRERADGLRGALGSDLSVDAQDAEGVLTSDRITETDILDGRWDKPRSRSGA